MLGTPTTKAARQPICLLCKAPLVETDAANLWLHPESAICQVRVASRDGLSLDDDYEVEDGVVYERTKSEETALVKASDWSMDLSDDSLLIPAGALVRSRRPSPSDFSIEFQRYYSHDKAINEMFDEFKVEKLGGASGDLGWSSFSAFQRCPYLWYRNYIQGMRAGTDDLPLAIVTGSLFHLFLALHYQGIIDPNYPITPEAARGFMMTKGVNIDGLRDAWRIYSAYDLLYVNDYIKPLAVEYHTVDPKTRESCRYDLLAEVEPGNDYVAPGVYVVEHKTTGRFDDSSLTGWVNDGEVLGQIMLYERLKLAKRFGPLQGVIVNICGKQKEPQFHRTFVSPNRWQTKQHAKDLKAWQAFRQLCVGINTFPRARANCINRFGKCSQWDHCATGEG